MSLRATQFVSMGVRSDKLYFITYVTTRLVQLVLFIFYLGIGPMFHCYLLLINLFCFTFLQLNREKTNITHLERRHYCHSVYLTR